MHKKVLVQTKQDQRLPCPAAAEGRRSGIRPVASLPCLPARRSSLAVGADAVAGKTNPLPTNARTPVSRRPDPANLGGGKTGEGNLCYSGDLR